MAALIVIENPRRWRLHVPGAEVVSAKEYLTHPAFDEQRRAKVYNFCRSYAYQSLGYYVSLLAAARGHRPIPSVKTIQDLRQSSILRIVSDDLDERLQRNLGSLKSREFELSIYFGRNLAKRYDGISTSLFNHFPAPFLRAEFAKRGRWRLVSLRPIATNEIPPEHEAFVIAQAQRYFARPRRRGAPRFRYDLAILLNPEERDPPSNRRSIQKFMRAARSLGMDPSLIGREDFGRLAEFDALFIRETTNVNHHTYRFANRAQAEGLVVVDDPVSILRCTNKVYQAEIFDRDHLPSPRTLIVHRENLDEVARELGFPCVLKRPDGSFSSGVEKAEDPEEFRTHVAAFLQTSELVVAQEYVPSGFDWRVGVLDGRPLYACKYFMAPGHWQIRRQHGGKKEYGAAETVPVEMAPPRAVDLAVRAARLIGDGFYGVDVKEVDGRFLVMEVNDNPTVEAGIEDAVLGEALYLAVMRLFYERLERRGKRELAL